jgi:hypothetical protein
MVQSKYTPKSGNASYASFISGAKTTSTIEVDRYSEAELSMFRSEEQELLEMVDDKSLKEAVRIKSQTRLIDVRANINLINHCNRMQAEALDLLGPGPLRRDTRRGSSELLSDKHHDS